MRSALRLIEELWEDLGISVDEDEFPVTPEQIDEANAALIDRAGSSSWAGLRAKLADRADERSPVPCGG